MIIALSLARCQRIICIVLHVGRIPKSYSKCKSSCASHSVTGYKWIKKLEGFVFIIPVTLPYQQSREQNTINKWQLEQAEKILVMIISSPDLLPLSCTQLRLFAKCQLKDQCSAPYASFSHCWGLPIILFLWYINICIITCSVWTKWGWKHW